MKAAKAKEKAEEDKRRRELSEEEKQVIIMSDEFHRFFDRSTRLVERAIWEEPNVFIDYTGGTQIIYCLFFLTFQKQYLNCIAIGKSYWQGEVLIS